MYRVSSLYVWSKSESHAHIHTYIHAYIHTYIHVCVCVWKLDTSVEFHHCMCGLSLSLYIQYVYVSACVSMKTLLSISRIIEGCETVFSASSLLENRWKTWKLTLSYYGIGIAAILIIIEGHETAFNSVQYQFTTGKPETDSQLSCDWQ
jgi:hypothetical protein